MERREIVKELLQVIPREVIVVLRSVEMIGAIDKDIRTVASEFSSECHLECQFECLRDSFCYSNRWMMTHLSHVIKKHM